MYKLLNYMFGWDYIAWNNYCDSGIARVHKAVDGRVWYWRYKITNVMDEVKTTDQVMWLTCHPDKYLP